MIAVDTSFDDRFQVNWDLWYFESRMYSKNESEARFNPNSWILGTIIERDLWKNSINFAYDFTVGTSETKLYVHKGCRSSNLMALIPNSIRPYEGNFVVLNKNKCHLRNQDRARFSRKNLKHRSILKKYNDAHLIFFRKTRSVTVPRFGFFPGFTDKG